MYESQEKKQYSIIGKVEIGTDEYRDLIEQVAELTREKDRVSSDKWKEYTRANDAENKVKLLTAERDRYLGFINSTEEIKSKYRAWIAEEQIKAMQEGNNED